MNYFKHEGIKMLPFFLILSGLIILLSCGGVVGNISKYKLNNCNEIQVISAINQFYRYYPEFKKNDFILYGKNDSENYYFKLKRYKI